MLINKPTDNNSKGRKFGINNATIESITYDTNDKGNKNFAVTVLIEGTDKPMWTIRFPINKIFKDRETVVDLDAGKGSTTSPEYLEELENQLNEMIHILMSFMPFEEVQEAFAKVKSFKTSEELLEFTAKTAAGKCEGKKVNVFLTYPWSPNPDGRKYLNLPKNTKHGFWIAPFINDLKPVVNEEGNTHYTNSKGEESPIKRSNWYMNSNFAKKTEVDLSDSSDSSGDNSESPW